MHIHIEESSFQNGIEEIHGAAQNVSILPRSDCRPIGDLRTACRRIPIAFNQCLQMLHKSAITARRADPGSDVPWSGFDLIRTFNEWKKSEDAGRLFVVDSSGGVVGQATGLAWRGEVCQQVFEEAAVDCGRVLAAWSQSRSGKRRGKRVGFPKFKKKSRTLPSFRLRNRHPKQGKPLIRVGESHPRSVTLPSIGAVRVHNDTRSLRRLTRAGAKIVYGTVSDRAGHWWLALNVDTPDLHPAHRHSEQCSAGEDSWVGVDVGLTSFLVAATVDGIEVARIDQPPKPLSTGIRRQRFLAKSLSRKEINSNHRRKAAARLARHHNRIRNIRSHSFMKSRTIWSRPTTVSC